MNTVPATFARDAVEVARQELLDSLRTRRVLVMALLFVVGGAGSGYGLGQVMTQAEQAARAAGAAIGAAGGDAALASQLQGTEVWQQIIGKAVDDPDAAASLARQPPLALAFAWVAMLFAPLLVLVTASETIGAEVETRAVRYTLLRTGRGEYVVGKLLGQLAILAAVVALSGVAFLVTGGLSTEGVSLPSTALAMARFWPWVVVDALPWLALAVGASMLATSAQGARAIALGAAIGMALLHSLAGAAWLAGLPSVVRSLLDGITPYGRGFGVIFPVGVTMARSLALCLGLSVLYLGASFSLFRRRDL